MLVPSCGLVAVELLWFGGDTGRLILVGEVDRAFGEYMLLERTGSCISALVGLRRMGSSVTRRRPFDLASK